MIDVSAVGVATAFAAGVVSFVSPCVLPLVPAYASYVAGGSVRDAHPQSVMRLGAATMGVFFVLGFSVVFIALGASATAVGQLLLSYKNEAAILGGGLLVLFGLVMLGPLGRIGLLQRDWRFHPRLTSRHPANAFLLGTAFGFGWTPCIGPILGAILTLSAAQDSVSAGIGLLSAYALGLAVPFLLAAVFMRELVGWLRRLRYVGRWLQPIAGAVMVVGGIAMMTGQLTAVSVWMLNVLPILGRIG